MKRAHEKAITERHMKNSTPLTGPSSNRVHIFSFFYDSHKWRSVSVSAGVNVQPGRDQWSSSQRQLGEILSTLQIHES